MITADPDRFFAALRAAFGALTQGQVDGANRLLAGLGADPRLSDPRQAAYLLATAWHETDATLQPVREIGRGQGRRYGRPGRHGGQVPYGRGYVQLTWDANYERADRELGLGGRLIADYDLALDPAIAYAIASRGMVEGWFTGRRLCDFIHADRCDLLRARQIINRMDRAALIAGYARTFAAALGVPLPPPAKAKAKPAPRIRPRTR